MNKLIVILGLISGPLTLSAQCDHTQLYPADTVIPVMDWTLIDSCSKAGQFALIHVEEGMYYGFSTLATHGSDITYDSQLTLRKTNGDLIAYNDDSEGNNLQSIIYWTANFTGAVELHLSEYDCQINDTCGRVMVFMSEGVGLNEELTTNQLQVFPNPSSGNFLIQLSDFDKYSVGEIVISNLLGQTVERITNPNSKTHIDLTGSKGVFLITLRDELQQVVHIERVVVE